MVGEEEVNICIQFKRPYTRVDIFVTVIILSFCLFI